MVPNAVKIKNAIVLVELADTEEKRAQGLMFRDSLEKDRGMLFVFDPPVRPGFYMKNTAIPLDILFINVSNRIISIHQMEPFNEKDIHRPPGPARFALEVNQGWARKHGIGVGDTAVLTNQ